MRKSLAGFSVKKLARKQAWGLLAAPLLLAGCNSPDAATAAAGGRRPLYFDVKGLLDQQVKALAEQHAAAGKQVMLRNGATENVRVPAVKWADELQIFYQADINKSALRGVYAIDSASLADGTVRHSYTRRTEHDNAPVRELTVSQKGGIAQEVTATIVQNNPLFTTRKKLQLQLQNGRLYSYKVVGTQKLVLFDSLNYAMTGRVE